jgi:multiple sugar transport system substrate-binding protein
MRLHLTFLAAVLAAVLLLAGCGGDDEGGDTGSGGSQDTGATKDAKAAPTLEEAKDATGEVKFCLGKDTSGNQTESVKRFNAQFGDKGLTAKLTEFPESADEQRNQFVQRQQAKAPDCDIFYSDVIWTAEFAAQGWLLDMSEYVESRKDELIQSTLETVTYEDKYFGMPQQTDAGFLYYRTDKVKEVPATWQAVYEEAAKTDGIAYQGAAYEGLTCNFLELAFAAGGEVLNEDGSESVINSPENLEALKFMVDGIKDGAAPKAVTTYMEEPARRAFEAERVTFQRNWPYAYALGEKNPKVKGKFEVAPFPEWEGGGTAGILGGHNLVISAYSQNPKGAVALIDFLTSEEIIKMNAAEFSLAPTLTATYDDPAVKKALPFAAELKQAVEQAKSRPVSPVYSQVSQAIYKNVNAALSGQMSPEDALTKAEEDMNRALATF